MVCPVAGLEIYVKEAQSIVSIFPRAIFLDLLITLVGTFFDTHVTTPVMHSRLKYYLKLFGIDEGETIHGIRGGVQSRCQSWVVGTQRMSWTM